MVGIWLAGCTGDRDEAARGSDALGEGSDTHRELDASAPSPNDTSSDRGEGSSDNSSDAGQGEPSVQEPDASEPRPTSSDSGPELSLDASSTGSTAAHDHSSEVGTDDGAAPPVAGPVSVKSNGQLRPSFDVDTTDYDVTLPILSTHFVLDLEALSGSEVSINGVAVSAKRRWASEPLSLGATRFELEVKGPSDTKTYRFNVTRKEPEMRYLGDPKPDLSGYGFLTRLDHDGSTFVIGSTFFSLPPGEDTEPRAGVWVHTRDGEEWSLPDFLDHPEPPEDTSLAWAADLSGSGDTLVAGEGGDGIYLLEREDNGWSFDVLLEHPRYGSSFAISDDGQVIAAGPVARATDPVVVFHRTQSGWKEEPPVENPAVDSSACHWFGWTLALDATGEILAIGSPGDGNEGCLSQVYIYARTEDGWSAPTLFEFPDTGYEIDDMTLAMDSAGEVLAVGRPYSTDVFARNGETWTRETTLEHADAADDHIALSASGLTLISNNGIYTRLADNWAFEAALPEVPPVREGLRLRSSMSGDGLTIAQGPFLFR